MRRGMVMLVGMSLVVAACGGSGSDDAATSTTGSQTADTRDEPEPETTTSSPPSDEPPVPSGDEGTGTATVGDMTWEVGLTGSDGRESCDLDFSGLVFISMFADEFATTLSISGPNTGGNAVVQAGSVAISDELWIADANVYSEYSATEGIPDGIGATITVNGNVVSGTGTFYEGRTMNETRISGDPYEAGVLEGTFSATCPEG